MTESPKWNQEVEFDVESGQDTLYLRLYECQADNKGQKKGKVRTHIASALSTRLPLALTSMLIL